jgi:integrase/recombinase XerD
MFEKLFKYPRVLARHREGPLAEERDRFLSYLAERGAAKDTLLRFARELLVVSREINLVLGQQIGIEDIEALARRWARRQQRRHRAQTERWSRQLFILTATQWLRFLGSMREPPVSPVPFAHLLDNFACCMGHDRNLSATTIHNYSWHVKQFLRWYSGQSRAFTEVSITDVDAFLALNGAKGWTRVSLASCAKALRVFFRHAEARCWCPPGIAVAIESPCIFKQEGLPTGPTWNDVRRLIASANTDRPCDIRDRAMLMLFAIYGLRSGEVAKLCIEDFDWEKEIIRVPRPKQRRQQEYPLTHEVGEVVIRYLREGRPSCSRREVFLTLKAPIRPLSPSGLYDMTSKRLSQLGIVAPHRGPHTLRHACAGHLVSEGFSLKEIGDHLGHRSVDATRIYAKVDLPGLREVASFDLGGLS